uniref:PDZ domain-containing protein n=1 Tax=Hemiselmis andersenii TaxID=464988 RepID=A0A6T8ITU7_HEMAN|mmetsp:Transcript_15907/g.36736  ORF Transcript_15907/g.36736 Transcript_15907/m.36736 type:complete len:479 (-) Transcript_15907:791-2227(-)
MKHSRSFFLFCITLLEGADAFHAPSLAPLSRPSGFHAAQCATFASKIGPRSSLNLERERTSSLRRHQNGVVALRSQVFEAVVPALSPALQGISSGVGSLAGILVLGGVIAFHELGHFSAARIQGITVQDFSIGFGPKVLQFQDKEGISYSLRLLPLGGFVSFPEAMSDEEKAEMDEEDRKDMAEAVEKGEYVDYDINDPDLLQNRPVAQRAFVLSAGVIFNMILSFGAILLTVTSGGVMEPILKPGVAVPAIVSPQGAGARYGLEAGDIVVAVNGEQLTEDASETSRLVSTIKKSAGKELNFDIVRNGEVYEVSVVPDKTKGGDGIIGVKLTSNIEKVTAVVPSNPIDALALTSKEFVRIFTETLTGFGKIVSNLGQYAGSMAGPVGVMQMGAEAGQQGALLTFAALISINLGIMNALPLPALDGGQMLFLIYEAAAGKPLERKTMSRINGTALTVLLGLSLLLLVGDVEKLIPLQWR